MALQLGTHLAHDGGWRQIKQPCDVIELFSTDAPVSLAVSSAGGRATQPCDGGLGNSLRPAADRQQLFEDVESWKPRLTVAYLPHSTPWVSELALEMVQRQRAGASGIHSTPRCHRPLVTTRRDSIWFMELWMVGLRLSSRDDTILVGCDDDSLGWTIE